MTLDIHWVELGSNHTAVSFGNVTMYASFCSPVYNTTGLLSIRSPCSLGGSSIYLSVDPSVCLYVCPSVRPCGCLSLSNLLLVTVPATPVYVSLPRYMRCYVWGNVFTLSEKSNTGQWVVYVGHLSDSSLAQTVLATLYSVQFNPVIDCQEFLRNPKRTRDAWCNSSHSLHVWTTRLLSAR